MVPRREKERQLSDFGFSKEKKEKSFSHLPTGGKKVASELLRPSRRDSRGKKLRTQTKCAPSKEKKEGNGDCRRAH